MGFPRHQSTLVLASLITVASFVTATAYTQNRLATLDALSSTIETNAAPSVEYLGRAGVELRRLRQLLYDVLDPTREQSAALNSARSELTAVERDIASYLQLTPLPGERPLWDSLRIELRYATDIARSILTAEQEGDTAAASLLRKEIEAAFDRADRAMLAALEFDVSESQRLAREVRELRRTTLDTVIWLDGIATALALSAAFIAYRASRRHDRLLNEHSALLAARVAELDQFSGRVAHDILNPLGTIGVALALVARTADSHARTHIERAEKALRRVQELVRGLLAFARSGVQPGSTAHCTLDVVLASIAADCSEAARENGIDLVVEPSDPVDVACSVGVLTSVAQNLVGNAIKYMGDAPVRRVIVRAKTTGQMVRLNVEDTGPGIDAELQKQMFEPFTRGQHETIGGIGLGLATVRRLVEAHGGTVGVKSSVGAGALFWVELPLASASVHSKSDPTSQFTFGLDTQ
jgi:signal transduction histidine kinase